MKSKSNKTNNYIFLFLILIFLVILYRRFLDKLNNDENIKNRNCIEKYLLDDVILIKSKKPILWIHIPYEYNSRNWLSFGSRSSFELNQPYLYLTVRSIIENCDNSFTICIIDDNSFSKLIPGWNIDMSKISNPISENMRILGLMKLLYIYGGLICPISFLCIKNLITLYNKGIHNNKMFVCETVNRNITSTTTDFYPNIEFSGSLKENQTVLQLINFIQQTISSDYTADSKFSGNFDRWINYRIRSGEINLIDGYEIGIKTVDDKQILIEHLLSQNYLKISKETYGILIPSNEILSRNSYEWFARLNCKQVLESDTILGNYILITIGENGKNIIEPLTPIINKEIKNEFVGFWRTPNYPGLYGLKPNFLGDNITKKQYTGL